MHFPFSVSRESSGTTSRSDGSLCDNARAPFGSLKSLLDNAPDAVARFDRHLRHVYVNLATARANNRPVEDFHLKTMREMGHSEEISSLLERHLMGVFSTGMEDTFDVDFVGPHGRRYFQCRMAPELSKGVVETVIVFSRDLTDLKLAQDKLLESERCAAASRLAHELAHELNNPLQALRNSFYLLQTESEKSRHDEYLKLADATLSRIESLARAILLLERIAPADNPPSKMVLEKSCKDLSSTEQ